MKIRIRKKRYIGNNSIFVITILICMVLSSCQKKTYTPDPFAFRDPDLIGTWRFDMNYKDDSSFFIFTESGYSGSVNYIDNAQLTGFTDLYEIWKNLEEVGDDGWGKIYTADSYNHWTKMRSENEEYYRLSKCKDTLFWSYVDLKTKKADKENPDTLYRNDYNIVYNESVYDYMDTTITP